MTFAGNFLMLVLPLEILFCRQNLLAVIEDEDIIWLLCTAKILPSQYWYRAAFATMRDLMNRAADIDGEISKHC